VGQYRKSGVGEYPRGRSAVTNARSGRRRRPITLASMALLDSRSSRLTGAKVRPASVGSLAPALRYFLRPPPPHFGNAPLHDRSSAYQLHAGLYRFICENAHALPKANRCGWSSADSPALRNHIKPAANSETTVR
jgi:hypothetical protein